MHMGDALISPAVGAAMWTATAATTVYCAKKVREEMDESNVPLMGVLGAFVFAAQMVNFTIPGTGSSGHLAGGMILSILLGSQSAFLVMGSVLTVQALFFADGGLLSLGANVFNLGFFPAFIAYPLVYRRMAGANPTRTRLFLACVTAAVVALQFGSLGVVLQTTLSGVTELGPAAFATVMQPIHLAIGIVEGLATAAVVMFVKRAQPDLIVRTARSTEGPRLKTVLLTLGVVAAIAAGGLSLVASANPDGLEWAISRVTGDREPQADDAGVRDASAAIQEKTALLPEYTFKGPVSDAEIASDAGEEASSAIDLGTSVSGVVGTAITLGLAFGLGWALKRRSRRAMRAPSSV